MEFARILYLSENLTQKAMAERVGVTEKTIGRWIEKEGWKKLKRSLLTTKQTQLNQLYDQLEWLNNDISNRDNKVADSKEADVISKITAAIQRLEIDASVGETVEVARAFIEFVRQDDLEQAKKITAFFDAYIQTIIK